MPKTIERKASFLDQERWGRTALPPDLIARVETIVNKMEDIRTGKTNEGEQKLLTLQEELENILHLPEMSWEQQRMLMETVERIRSDNRYVELFALREDALTKHYINADSVQRRLNEIGPVGIERIRERDAIRMEITLEVIRKELPYIARAFVEKAHDVHEAMRGNAPEIRIQHMTQELYTYVGQNEYIPDDQKRALYKFIEEFTDIKEEELAAAA